VQCGPVLDELTAAAVREQPSVIAAQASWRSNSSKLALLELQEIYLAFSLNPGEVSQSTVLAHRSGKRKPACMCYCSTQQTQTSKQANVSASSA
jgi:hypothetical protein